MATRVQDLDSRSIIQFIQFIQTIKNKLSLVCKAVWWLKILSPDLSQSLNFKLLAIDRQYPHLLYCNSFLINCFLIFIIRSSYTQKASFNQALSLQKNTSKEYLHYFDILLVRLHNPRSRKCLLSPSASFSNQKVSNWKALMEFTAVPCEDLHCIAKRVSIRNFLNCKLFCQIKTSAFGENFDQKLQN